MTSSTSPPQTPPWIYINAYPAAGKLTIARHLARHLGPLCPPGTEARVYDNHLLIDPVAYMLERGDVEYQAVRAELRTFLLEKIATSPSTQRHTWIFTDSQSSNPTNRVSGDAYRAAARKRGAPFISIVLDCSLEANERRLLSRIEHKETSMGSKTKLADIEVLRMIRETEDIRRFGDEADAELVVDVTGIEAEEAAAQIGEFVERFLRTA